MKASYISYYEGYDSNGHVVFNGNGSVTIEYSDCVDPDGLVKSHSEALLAWAKERNNAVVRVVIKGLTKL